MGNRRYIATKKASRKKQSGKVTIERIGWHNLRRLAADHGINSFGKSREELEAALESVLK